MTTEDINQLSPQQLRMLKRHNLLSFHSFMLAAVVLLFRAFSDINAVVLLLSFGLMLVARMFYQNARFIDSLRENRVKAR